MRRDIGIGGVRPRVAIVVHAIDEFGGMDRAFAELIVRGSERYDFTVFSTTLTLS